MAETQLPDSRATGAVRDREKEPTALLLVGDAANLRELLGEGAPDEAFSVATCEADRAVEVARSRAFDVVLVPGDLLVSGPLGLGLVDRLRRGHDAAVVVVGGPVDRFPAAFARGAAGAVVRPNDRDEVRTVIAGAGARRRAERERLDALEEARKTRKFFEDVLRGLGEGIVVVDAQGRIRYRNPEAARILGEDDDATPERADASGFFRLKQLVLAPLLQLLVQTLADREAKQKMVALEENDEKVFLDVTTSVLRAGDGRETGAVAVVRDRSAEKILEEQLAHTERLATLGSLLAAIAHEIANPLSVITGCAEVGQDAAHEAGEAAARTTDPVAKDALDRLSKDVRDILDQVRDAGLRCQTIANNLLQYSRRTPARVVEQDLNELIRKTLGFVGKYLGTDKVVLDLDLDPALPPARVDAAQLQQALTNLIDNAVHAMLAQRKIPVTRGGGSSSGANASPAPGQAVASPVVATPASSTAIKLSPPKLTIRTRVEDGRALIAISDNGPGIGPRQLERIWRPFYTTKERGTGLGLYITRRAVEHQGGTIALETKVGHGTTFTMRLPL